MLVPVCADDDRPGAQKLGSRFEVSSYPTMLLFSSQGVEIDARDPKHANCAALLTLLKPAPRPAA